MTNFNLLFPSAYIRACDLRGQDLEITISKVERLPVQGQRGVEKKAVATFSPKTGEAELWILNRTNARAIAKLHGAELEAWSGKKVTLYPTTTQVGAETKDCIRVRTK